MSIVKMKRLRLIGMQSERDRLLRQLQHLGCVEISQPTPLPDDPDWAALVRPDAEALGRDRQARGELEGALAALNKYAPHKTGLLKPKPVVSESALFDQSAYQAALEAAQAVDEDERRMGAIHAEQSKLRSQKAQLQPWLELDVPLDVASTRDVTMLLGAVSANADWSAVQAEVDAASQLAQLTRAGKDRDLQYFLLMVHKQDEQAVMEALKGYGFTRASLRGWTGTAAENDQQLDARLRALAEELDQVKSHMVSFADRRSAIQLALDRVRQEIDREEAKGRLLDTGVAYFLEGWAPAESLPALEKTLGGFVSAWDTRDPTPEEYPDVPVKLKNNAFTKPLNMVTEMYSLPAYDGLDPNPLMAPFFILFYGIMMADMGYGLIMMLASVIVLKKARPKGTMYNLFALMGLCGITTFIMGALTGGFFGDFIPQLLKLIDPASTFELPALFTPLTDTLAILIGSLVLGFIQVITGNIISFVKQTKDGQFLDALFNEGAWWVIYIGAALAILGVGNPGGVPVVLILGGVMLVVGCVRQNPSIKVLGTLLGTVYNGVTGIFSDVLSYSRLMALMLSGSIIASVFNTLGTTANNVVAFIIIAMIGNTLNFALNILGCFVHDLRLQCLEFFGKFYKDGGKAFRPLAINTKFVEVMKEEQ